jgi:hypothetical protein
MGFASISTELLPARHAGDGPGARADASMVEWTISG